MSEQSVNTVKASDETPKATSDDQLPRRSDRVSNPTERMAEYKLEEFKKREKKLFSAFDDWRTMIRNVKNTLKNPCEEQTLTKLLDSIEAYEESVLNRFQEIRSLGTVSQETVRKVDACYAVSADITKIMNERLCEIDSFNAEAEITRLGQVKHAEYAKSIFSTSDNTSCHSVHSTHSKLSESIVEATADLAAKKTELKMLNEEQKQKEKLIQLEYEQRKAPEAHQNELKRLETRRELEITHARLNANSQINDMVRDYNETTLTSIDKTLSRMKQESTVKEEPTFLATGMNLPKVIPTNSATNNQQTTGAGHLDFTSRPDVPNFGKVPTSNVAHCPTLILNCQKTPQTILLTLIQTHFAKALAETESQPFANSRTLCIYWKSIALYRMENIIPNAN